MLIKPICLGGFIDEFGDDKKTDINKNISQVIQVAEDTSNMILKILDCYENADYKNAQNFMDELMKDLEEDIFVGSIDDIVCINCNGQNYSTNFRMSRGHRFFRVRSVDYESTSIQNNANELFHIPLSKRAYSNNERFSLVGFPSLYLSTMLPLAWQECGYPQKYYYSEYKL